MRIRWLLFHVTLAAVHYYYVRNNVHVERLLYSYELLQLARKEGRSLGLANCSLVTDYTLRYCCNVQVNGYPDEGLSWRVLGVADCI
jgi:hypothetical protein